MASKWIQKAIPKDNQGSLREYFGVKQGDTIPPARLESTITALQNKEKQPGGLSAKESKLLHECLLARTLKKM